MGAYLVAARAWDVGDQACPLFSPLLVGGHCVVFLVAGVLLDGGCPVGMMWMSASFTLCIVTLDPISNKHRIVLGLSAQRALWFQEPLA